MFSYRPSVQAKKVRQDHFLLRLLALICLIAMLLLALLIGSMQTPAVRAQRGDPAVLLDGKVAQGGQILLQGYGFPAGAPFTIVLHDRQAATTTGLAELDSDRGGVIGPARADLPAATGPGTYELRALDRSEDVVATASLTVQRAPSIQLNPASGPPGTMVEISVEDLIPGNLRIDVNGKAVLGPLPVRGTSYNGRFTVPAQRGNTSASAHEADEPLQVTVVNLTGGLTVGRGSTRFVRQTLDPPPRYSVPNLQSADTELQPGDTFNITGKLEPPPAHEPEDYQIVPYWQDAQGREIPIGVGDYQLAANGEFQVAARLPSLLRGDAISAKPDGQYGVAISGPDGTLVKQAIAQNVLVKYGIFRVVAVKDLPGDPEDGKPIPNTPKIANQPDPLLVSIEPLGVISTGVTNTLILSGAEPILDVPTIINQLTANAIKEQSKELLEELVNCIKWVDPTSDLKWWEWVIDPWDTMLLATLNAPVFDPALQGIESEVPGVATAQSQQRPLSTHNDDPLPLFFVFRVTVDAARVVDGDQQGYGIVDGLNRAIPTEVHFVWVPLHDLIFELDLSAMTAKVTDNPAPIRMPPLPEGWKSNLVVKEIDVGNRLVDQFDPDPVQPRYGEYHSFVRPQYSGGLNPAIQFTKIDPLRITVYLSNIGADATFIEPEVTIKFRNQTYQAIKSELPAEEPGPSSCYNVDGQIHDSLANFIWTVDIPNPHKIPPGDHLLEVEVSDGINVSEKSQALLQFVNYPSWYDTLPLSNRQVEWESGKIHLRADALDPSQAKTNVSDNIAELNDPNSKVNVGSSFVCTIDAIGVGLQTQTGTMNSAALDNPAQPQNIDEFSYCASPLWAQAAAMQPASHADPGLPGHFTAASISAPQAETAVTILDTGKIRVFQASYGIPGIATVGVAVDFRVYATSLINDTVESGIHVDFDSGVQVDIFIEADILLGLASIDFGFTSDIGVAIPVGFTWAGGIQEPQKCFHYALDLFYDIEVLWGAVDVSDGSYNVFEGDEPNNCYNFLHAARAHQIQSPPASNPAIATDGFNQTMALWRTEDGHIVYSSYNGGAWDAAATLAANGKSGDPAIAFFGPNQAVAVWSQSGLSSSPGNPTTAQIPAILAQQHLAYSVWDGTAWSAPMNLTTPTTGDGKVALAACPSTDADCPASGEVTAVWVHDEVGDVAQRQFRIYSATFQNDTWTANGALDPNTSSAETEPAITYVGSHPLATWVRDADRVASTIADRQLALRFLDGGAVQIPNALPSGILNPDLKVDSQGDVQMAFTVLDPQDKLISNRRQLYRGKGVCGGTTSCTWTIQKLTDTLGRTIYAEQPVVTVDGNDQVTLTYRGMGFDPATVPHAPVAAIAEPLGIVQHTGELAQIVLPAALGNNASPGYLTGDGAVNWRAAAAYVPPLNTTVALAVKGPAPVPSLTASAIAQEVNPRAEPIQLDQPVIFAALPQLPNFVVTNVKAGQPTTTGAISVTASILNAGISWPAEGEADPISIEAFWDETVWTDNPATATTHQELKAGESVDVVLPLTPPAQNPGAQHTISVIVNRGQPIAEQTDQDNSRTVTVNALPAPAQVRGYTLPEQRLTFLEWQPSSDLRVTGYRIYRIEDGTPQVMGTTHVAGWFDANVAWEDTYQYHVRSYDASFTESTASDAVSLTVPAQPVRSSEEPELEHQLSLPHIQK